MVLLGLVRFVLVCLFTFNKVFANSFFSLFLFLFLLGAFRNPSDKVATAYKEELLTRLNNFEVIVFAIYGKDRNYGEFVKMFEDLF